MESNHNSIDQTSISWQQQGSHCGRPWSPRHVGMMLLMFLLYEQSKNTNCYNYNCTKEFGIIVCNTHSSQLLYLCIDKLQYYVYLLY